MSISEIDDIFASSKGKGKLASQPVASSSALFRAGNPSRKKTKKAVVEKAAYQKKRRHNDATPPVNEPRSAGKRRTAETVVDPSLRVAPKPSASVSGLFEKATKKRKLADVVHERFKDSRGIGPRRTTDEGFLIYKEDELGITDQGGDTLLCPFDCDCCF